MNSDWHSYQLGDLTTFKYGKFLAKSQLADQGFPVFSGYGVVGYLPEYQFDAPQLLMVCRGEGGTGDVKMSPPKCSITNLSIVFSVNESKVTKNFLYWALKARDTRLLRTGSAQAQIVIGSLENFRVEIPARKSEQIAIAGFLDSIEERITLLRETNATLEAITQALFKSWFVDFDPVRTKQEGRAPEGMDEATAALFPDGFEESELGLVPKGWRVGKVSDLAGIKGGKQLEKTDFSDEGPNPVFGGAGVMGHTGLANATGLVITVGRVGAYCGQFFWHLGDAWVNNNASLIVPSCSSHGLWLYQWLRQADIEKIKKGAAQPFVSNGDIAGMQLFIPTDEAMQSFTSIANFVYERLHLNKSKAQTLATLRDTLLPRLISGQLRLPEAEAIVAAV